MPHPPIVRLSQQYGRVPRHRHRSSGAVRVAAVLGSACNGSRFRGLRLEVHRRRTHQRRWWRAALRRCDREVRRQSRRDCADPWHACRVRAAASRRRRAGPRSSQHHRVRRSRRHGTADRRCLAERWTQRNPWPGHSPTTCVRSGCSRARDRASPIAYRSPSGRAKPSSTAPTTAAPTTRCNAYWRATSASAPTPHRQRHLHQHRHERGACRRLAQLATSCGRGFGPKGAARPKPPRRRRFGRAWSRERARPRR